MKPRKFPWIATLTQPPILSSGIEFPQNVGETRDFSKHQEFSLNIKKRKEDDSQFPTCEVILSVLSDNLIFVLNNEDNFKQFGFTAVGSRFEHKFNLKVIGKSNVNSKGEGKIQIEMISQGRKSNPQVIMIEYQPALRIEHSVQFVSGDFASISLKIQNNFLLPIELSRCELTTTEELSLKTSDNLDFPYKLPNNKYTLRLGYIVSNLNSIVPERAGGRSLTFITFSTSMKLLQGLTECEISWRLPLLVRRAKVVRIFKDGQTLSFMSPPIEDARFGLDPSDLDDELIQAPSISVDEEIE